MNNFLKPYYDTEGPLGIPMLDRQALALEPLLKDLPKDDAYRPGTLVVEKATTELLRGERADVSWISTEDPDRCKDVALSTPRTRSATGTPRSRRSGTSLRS